ncbi:MAG: DUF1674 domain-containing protein [Alphaproteobacteria bacterium]
MTKDRKTTDIKKPVKEKTNTAEASDAKPSKEHGGQEGPDPTRFGDWEKAGRCIDF